MKKIVLALCALLFGAVAHAATISQVQQALVGGDGNGQPIYYTFTTIDANFGAINTQLVAKDRKRTSTTWYPFDQGVAIAGVAPVANTMYFTGVRLNAAATLNHLTLAISTLAAGGNCYAALYPDSPGSSNPNASAPLAYTGAISTAAVGTTNTATFIGGSLVVAGSANFPEGYYWGAVICDNSTVVYTALSPLNTQFASRFGATSAAPAVSSVMAQGRQVPNLTPGTWPDASTLTYTDTRTAQSPLLGYFAITGTQ